MWTNSFAEKVKVACHLGALVLESGNSHALICLPDDKTLGAIEREDFEATRDGEFRKGNNVYVLEWSAKGVQGMRDLLEMLFFLVDKNSVLAGRRHGKSRRWTKEWYQNRRIKWAKLST